MWNIAWVLKNYPNYMNHQINAHYKHYNIERENMHLIFKEHLLLFQFLFQAPCWWCCQGGQVAARGSRRGCRRRCQARGRDNLPKRWTSSHPRKRSPSCLWWSFHLELSRRCWAWSSFWLDPYSLCSKSWLQSPEMKQQNLEEVLIWTYLVLLTWPFDGGYRGRICLV